MPVQSAPTSRFAIHGCYNNGNFGDLLILDVMAKHAERVLGVAPLCLRMREESLPFVQAAVGNRFRDLFEVDAGFFGGGGYFCDYFRRSLGYSIPARIWRARRVPYVVAGIGVGPFITPAAISQFRMVANGAEAICVRDPESRDQLASFGVDRDRIEVTADAVLGLTHDMIPPHALEGARELLGDLEDGRRRFLFQWGGAGPRQFTLEPPFHERAPHPSLVELLEGVKPSLANRDDIEIVWLLWGGASTAAATRRAVEEVLPGTRFVQSPDHWVTAAMLSLVDGVFTTMLHLGITAWTLGTPPCAWASHGKTERFYRQIGRERFVAPLGESKEAVQDWITAFLEFPEEFAVEREGCREILTRLSLRNYEVMEEHLAPALNRC